jgi:hypothetical protein
MDLLNRLDPEDGDKILVNVDQYTSMGVPAKTVHCMIRCAICDCQ